MNIIKKYYSWVHSLSKMKYIILVVIISLLQTFCITILPPIIDHRDNENVLTKICIIGPLFLILNLCIYLPLYNKRKQLS